MPNSFFVLCRLFFISFHLFCLFFCAGGRSNDSNNSYGLNGDDHHYPVPPPPPPPPQVKRELPSDLSKEELIKEAEKVIAQTERIKCTVDTPNSLAGIRKQEKLLEGNFANSSGSEYFVLFHRITCRILYFTQICSQFSFHNQNPSSLNH